MRELDEARGQLMQRTSRIRLPSIPLKDRHLVPDFVWDMIMGDEFRKRSMRTLCNLDEATVRGAVRAVHALRSAYVHCNTVALHPEHKIFACMRGMV